MDDVDGWVVEGRLDLGRLLLQLGGRGDQVGAFLGHRLDESGPECGDAL
jgi:hypothetical protein